MTTQSPVQSATAMPDQTQKSGEEKKTVAPTPGKTSTPDAAVPVSPGK